MNERLSVKLDDVAQLSGGYAFRSEQYTDRGRFVLRTVNITDDGRVTRDGATYISESEAESFEKFSLQPNDTLFVMVGATLGKIGRVRRDDLPALLNQNMWVIRARDGAVDPIYLHYAFREISKTAVSWASGSARGFLRRDDVRDLPLTLPTRPEQRLVGGLLSALDDKIALNRRLSETLEAMAQAVFRDWFFEFGPVRRKMAGSSDPVEVMGISVDRSRAAELAQLFPASLDADGLPNGWQRGTTSDLLQFNPPEPLRPGTVAPYSDMSSLPTRGSVGELPVMRPFGSGTRFRNGDALLARITPCLENGKGAWVDWLSDDMPVGWGSTEFIVMRRRAATPRPFGYLLSRDPQFRNHAIQSMTGTSGRQRVQADDLAAWPMAMPPSSVLAAFGEYAELLFARITAGAVESRTLDEARDYLLPKLISGELRIDDVPQEIAA